MLFSTVPVSLIGAQFAMNVRPFWTPDQFSQSFRTLDIFPFDLIFCVNCALLLLRIRGIEVPIVGMLCGNAISAAVITLNFILKEISSVPLFTALTLLFTRLNFVIVQ